MNILFNGASSTMAPLGSRTLASAVRVLLVQVAVGFPVMMSTPASPQGACQNRDVIGLMEDAIRQDGMFRNLVPRITTSRTVFDNPNADFPGTAVLACSVSIEVSGARLDGTVAFYPTGIPDTYRIRWSGGSPVTR